MARHAGSQFPNQESNPFPLQWKLGVLTTGRPGNSPNVLIQTRIPMKRLSQDSGTLKPVTTRILPLPVLTGLVDAAKHPRTLERAKAANTSVGKLHSILLKVRDVCQVTAALPPTSHTSIAFALPFLISTRTEFRWWREQHPLSPPIFLFHLTLA